jgi:hypothetical protein
MPWASRTLTTRLRALGLAYGKRGECVAVLRRLRLAFGAGICLCLSGLLRGGRAAIWFVVELSVLPAHQNV